jgi:hypothetical protein
LPYVVNENCICCTYIETSRLREGSQRKSRQGAVTTRLRIPVKACSPLQANNEHDRDKTEAKSYKRNPVS